jgi:propanol-preferring alcohol dehydrogenase
MGNPSGSPHDLRATLELAQRHSIVPDVTRVELDDAPRSLTTWSTAPLGLGVQ